MQVKLWKCITPFKAFNKIKYTFKDNGVSRIAFNRYKNEIKNNQYKYMIYSVGKGYGNLEMAKKLSLDDLIEAFQALALFSEESKG